MPRNWLSWELGGKNNTSSTYGESVCRNKSGGSSPPMTRTLFGARILLLSSPRRYNGVVLLITQITSTTAPTWRSLCQNLLLLICLLNFVVHIADRPCLTFSILLLSRQTSSKIGGWILPNLLFQGKSSTRIFSSTPTQLRLTNLLIFPVIIWSSLSVKAFARSRLWPTCLKVVDFGVGHNWKFSRVSFSLNIAAMTAK